MSVWQRYMEHRICRFAYLPLSVQPDPIIAIFSQDGKPHRVVLGVELGRRQSSKGIIRKGI
jgi:hypothetical protein